MNSPPPTWRMPAGVDRGLWDYLHDDGIARNYDDSLAGSSLFTLDLAFVEAFCQPPGRLLDLGCGTGRLLLHLATKGYRPLGVDLSHEMLAVAAAKARQTNADIDLLRANIVDLAGIADGVFDHAACLFSTLGMVRGSEMRQQTIAEVYRVLRKGGRFVLHVHNRWFNLYHPDGRGWLFADVWRRIRGLESGDKVMPPHQGIAGLTLHLFTRGEALALLRRAGFRIALVRAISTREDGKLAWPWALGGLRAYGYLIGAEK